MEFSLSMLRAIDRGLLIGTCGRGAYPDHVDVRERAECLDAIESIGVPRRGRTRPQAQRDERDDVRERLRALGGAGRVRGEQGHA